jgi:hypothetical protein
MPSKDTSQEQGEAEEERGPRKQQKQDAIAKAVVVLKDALVEQSDTNRKEEGRQNTVEKIIEVATLIFVVLTTIGIFWQATILNQSDHAIQKSAIAAKDAADAAKDAVRLSDKTAERQLRAYLHVSHGAWQQYPPQTPGSGPQYGAEIFINHAGATPGYKIRVDATIEVAPYLLNQTKLESPISMGGGNVTKREFAILYGATPIQLTVATPFSVDAIRLATSNDRLLGDHRFYLHGIIRYLDIFGLENPNLERRYEFCFIFHPDREPVGTEKGCEQYNKPG